MLLPLPSGSLGFCRDTMPLLTVVGTNNVWVAGVNLVFGITEKSGICRFGLIGPGKEFADPTCPGVYVINSYGIQINQVRALLCYVRQYCTVLCYRATAHPTVTLSLYLSWATKGADVVTILSHLSGCHLPARSACSVLYAHNVTCIE